jgi:hypothetical protein
LHFDQQLSVTAANNSDVSPLWENVDRVRVGENRGEGARHHTIGGERVLTGIGGEEKKKARSKKGREGHENTIVRGWGRGRTLGLFKRSRKKRETESERRARERCKIIALWTGRHPRR